MKPRIKLDTAPTPDGGEIMLFQHDRDFTIVVNGEDLMLSRHHESELELARLGCINLTGRKAPRILVGGLGMGYTLRQTLDMVDAEARVTVVELMDTVVAWNRQFLGELNDHPLMDQRVVLNNGDVVDFVLRSKGAFDAILLDVDNGPSAMTDAGNSRLYGYQGISACRQALRSQGCLAVWSASPNREFEQLLMGCGFHVRRYRVPAHKGNNSQSRFVWVASENENMLPDGGGEPRLTRGRKPGRRSGRNQKKKSRR